MFRGIASDLTLQDLLDINNKSYSEIVKDEIKESATLDCLRPALSLAGVLHLIERDGSKGIVIAGADEKIQWERAYDIGSTRDQLGVLMNPILKEDDRYQTRQRRNRPLWASQESLSDDMGGSNLAWWTYNLHAFLPEFPDDEVRIGDQNVSPSDWVDELQIPPKVQKEALVEHVWKFLNPSALLDQ